MRRHVWVFWWGWLGAGGIKGSYVISPFWSLEWGIAWEAQQGSTLSPTGASAKGLPHMGDADKCHSLWWQKRMITDLSWRKRGLRRGRPPCRWTTRRSRSSPPGTLSVWTCSILVTITNILILIMLNTSIARYPEAILRAKRKMIAARRDNPRNLGTIRRLCSNLQDIHFQ